MLDNMKGWLAPLAIFAGGMVLLAFSTIFYPAINAADTQMVAETAGIASNYYGHELWGSARIIMFVFGLIAVLLSAGWAYLKGKGTIRR